MKPALSPPNDWDSSGTFTQDTVTPGTNFIIDPDLSPPFVDAPGDGQVYGRKDGRWVVIRPSTDWPDDAPSDGKVYVRKNGAWIEFDPGEWPNDAPADMQIYGRQDGEWVLIQFEGT